MKRVLQTFIALIFACTAAISVFSDSVSAHANFSIEIELRDVIEGVINWKKSDVKSTSDGYLINDNFLKMAGQTAGDWFPIGLGRYGYTDENENFEGYRAVINDNVTKRYESDFKLDRYKATEWHRISMAVLSSGGNPRKMGYEGEIDLIADGTYNRVDANGAGILGRQGINGHIWGLLSLDSLMYAVPTDAYYSRDDIILNILEKQLSDGGFAMSGFESDPDITGMVLQAFSPYFNSEKVYEYQLVKIDSVTGKKVLVPVKKSIRQVVDEGLEWLSSVQLPDGDFYSWGMPNCESTVQVAVALTSLGVDIFSDSRFIKTNENGVRKTIYDGLLKYRVNGGGFCHSHINDADNPTAIPGKENTMASEQALYVMTAILRSQQNMRRLYDFRAEFSTELREQLNTVIADINNIDNLVFQGSKDRQEYIEIISRIYVSYLALPSAERSYVTNYNRLSHLMRGYGIEFEEEKIDYNNGSDNEYAPLMNFTEVDISRTNAFPASLSTEYRTEVLLLWNKINNCFDFEDKQTYKIKLDKLKNQIDVILKEIDSINGEILDKLHPFDHIGLANKKVIGELVERYEKLSDFDKKCITYYEDLLKAKTHTDNLTLALWISVGGGAVIILGIAFVILHIRSSKKKKRLAKIMEESDE